MLKYPNLFSCTISAFRAGFPTLWSVKIYGCSACMLPTVPLDKLGTLRSANQVFAYWIWLQQDPFTPCPSQAPAYSPNAPSQISIGVQKLSLVPSMARNSANGLHRTGIKACAQNINIRNCHVMSDNPLIAVGWSIRSTPSWRTLFKLAGKNLQPVEGIRTVACHCCRKQNGNLNDHRRVFFTAKVRLHTIWTK